MHRACGRYPCTTSPCCPAAWAARGSSRACCTASPPAGCPASRADAEVTVDRQHRRRHLGARAQGLPRPRHRDVHPRRRHRPRARLGPARRDVERQGRAGGVRRGADLVRPRRPRPRHPPGAHPDARRRLPAVRGHRGAVPALAHADYGERTPAADDRRPRRDPRRDRRPRVAERAAGRALPGVLGASCAPRCPPRRVVVVGLEDSTPGPGRHRRDHRRRPGASSRRPTRSSPSAPSSASRGCARRSRPRRRRSSASPPSSAAPTCAAWPSSC